MSEKVVKRLCGSIVAETLRSIGRWHGKREPEPSDFTEEERFAMFKHIMHEHVWPVADIIHYDGRITYSWVSSVWRWRHGGKRKFVEYVRKSAAAEIKEADYTVYDLTPIRCLIGNDGPRFCRLLTASDVAEMEQRMNGMEADLKVIDRKLDWFRREKESFGELKYRIALYDHTYEAVIRGGKGGWLWQNLI